MEIQNRGRKEWETIKESLDSTPNRQQMTVEPTPMEEVERTMQQQSETLQEQGREEEIRRDLYIMNVDRERNCYSYRGFGHLARNCRNWGVSESKEKDWV